MDIQIELSGTSCILFAVLCLLLPLNWLFAAILAGFIHECSHIILILLTGGKILEIRIGVSGTVIVTSEMGTWQEMICALAGPAGSFSLLLLSRYFPNVAACAVLQGVYNLMPIYPLDGGRALRCLLQTFALSATAEKIGNVVSLLTLCLILFAGLWFAVTVHSGFLMVCMMLLLLSRIWTGKISCKEGYIGVQ